MSPLAYEIVDVFTDQPFTGNPLAVVFGAETLATAQLQALAREFHLSETVFLLPPTNPEASYRARIFTPARELPFAGHPSIGAAVTAVRRGLANTTRLVQECGAGLLPIEVNGDRAVLTGGQPTVGPELDPAPLLAAVSLHPDDLAGPAPRAAGCGLVFHYLRVRPDAVARASLDSAAAASAGIGNLSVFSWDEQKHQAHARVFVPGAGVPEDPATGSAALGLGVWLVASGLLPGNQRSGYVIRQGVELHRPSVLECTVTAADGAALGATVAGQAVPVAHGEIMVPPFVG